MKVAICSAFRNATGYLERYLRQLDGLRQALAPHATLRPIWVEGDSLDATWDCLLDAAHAYNARLIACDHNGPAYGPVVDAQRFRQLAKVGNAAWRHIAPDAAAVMWVESDLIWRPDTLVALLGHLAEYPAVAPMVLHAGKSPHAGRGPHFYDVWGFVAGGVPFDNQPPYHPALNGDMLRLDSAGSCLALRASLARQVSFPGEDVFRGLCRQIYQRGGSVWLDPRLAVCHP